MKKLYQQLFHLLLPLAFLTINSKQLFAQVPNISYPATQTLNVGTAISPLSPTNKGGAVPANIFGQINSIAGGGAIVPINGAALSASFAHPTGVVMDASGNIFVTAGNENLIRKISAAGIVTTFAGSGLPGTADGTGTGASFNYPSALTIDASGNLYVIDANRFIRKISPTGVVSTLAAGFNGPQGLATDATGNVYVADTQNQLIRKISPTGIVTTLAGSGNYGYVDGTGTAASFRYPQGLATDAAGNVYVADTYVIRKITPAGVVTTFAGSGTYGYTDGTGNLASFGNPSGITIDASGNVYVTDNELIRKIDVNGVVTTLAGNNSSIWGFANGTGNAAQFSGPRGLTVDNTGNIFVADLNNNMIRKVDVQNKVTTFAGTGSIGQVDGTGNLAYFGYGSSVALDGAGNIYVADQGDNLIRKITSTGVVTTVAGSGMPGNTNGTGTAASFNSPVGVVVDAAGNLYVADRNNFLIRKITPAGVVTTFAGRGNYGSIDGTGTSASFGYLWSITIDASGNIIVEDNYLIRKISPSAVVTTLAGSGSYGSTNGTGTAASFGTITGLASDAAGNVYASDFDNNLIRKITSAGVVTTFAGNGSSGSKDGVGTAASFNFPWGITTDAGGIVYVADYFGGIIRKIDPTGLVTTLVKNNTAYTQSITIDAQNNLIGAGSNGIYKIPLTGYAINPSLPGGLSINGSGIISGTPTAASQATNYTVAAYNLSGSGTATISLAIGGISSFSPSTAAQGTLVNIIGTGLSGAKGVSFGGTAAQSFTVVNDGLITAVVGGGTSGSVKVTLASGNYSYSGFNYITNNPPKINYTTSTQTFTVGTAITAFLPTNSGSAVPAAVYKQVSTVAGSGTQGSGNGTGKAAGFNYPNSVATDAAGNVYVADRNNNLIRKIDASGVTTTLAGSGSPGSANGTGTAASFNNPTSVATDAAGNVYVADNNNQLIRKIDPSGVVTTLAGSGSIGSANGTGTAASFNYPQGVATDASGNVYVADGDNHLIRKIDPNGVVTTLAGSGSPGSNNGAGTSASFFYPSGVATDLAGNVYVADESNQLIRKISPEGIVTTLAGSGSQGSDNGLGTSASFYFPSSVATDAAGNVYVADGDNQLIRKIDPTGLVSTFAGSGSYGSANGIGLAASFTYPNGVATDAAGNVYIADTDNQLIRKISANGFTINPNLPAGINFDATTGTISGTPIGFSPATNYSITAYNIGGSSTTTLNLTVNLPQAPVISFTNSTQTYTAGNAITALSLTNTGGAIPANMYGQVTTFAGSGTIGNSNGTGVSASFNQPFGVATDAAGNVYVADSQNSLIRKISPDGTVTTLAGNANWGSSDGIGTAASFRYPRGLAVDPIGNVYVADANNNLIRKITSTGVVTTIAGTGTAGSTNGIGTAASFNYPTGIAIDANGNIYVADQNNSLIRKITPSGVVTTFAGSGTQGSADGTGTSASFNQAAGITIDASGNLYVADSFNNLIRKITPIGVVTTLAGTGKQGFADGVGVSASFYHPFGVAADLLGNVYVADENNNLIRKISSTGVVSTLAGNSSSGSTNALGTSANFLNPFGVATDTYGNIYIADKGNNLIRKIITTGYSIGPQLPAGLTFDATTGTISGTPTAITPATNYTITAYNLGGSSTTTLNLTVNIPQAPNIAYSNNTQTFNINTAIVSISPTNTGGAVPATIYGQVTTLAGSGQGGSANGQGTAASFNGPFGVAKDATGNIYVAEYGNNLIRKIDPSGNVTTFAGSGQVGSANGQGTAASFNQPTTIAIDASGNLYVADFGNNLIRKISPSGNVTTLAGSGQRGSVNAQGIAASFNGPEGLVFDAAGNLYVADAFNNLIRKIDLAGNVTTFAGNGQQGSANGQGTAASFNTPRGIAIDVTGNFYIGDQINNLIRKIDPNGNVTTFAGTGQQGSVNGKATSASFYYPLGVAVDVNLNVYVADVFNNLIRKIDPAGNVTTLAGTGQQGSANGQGTTASFNSPVGIAVDQAGNVYVAESVNNLIRKISITGYTINPALPTGLTFDATTGTISGTPTQATKAYNYTITAYNVGGSSTTTLSLAVLQSQTITFSPLPNAYNGYPDITPVASSTSNLPISFSSSNPAVAAITSTGNIHIVGLGNADITASQPGDNTNFSAAASVTQTLNVAQPPAPTITSLDKTTASAGNSINLTGTYFLGATAVSFGGTAATSFTVNSATSITAVVGNGASGNVTVTTPSGTGTLAGFNFVPAPTIAASGPTTILSDGAGVTLTANPSSGGYTYQWQNNGVNISGATKASYTTTQSGSYTVIITLNGVSQTSAATTVTSIFDLTANNYHLTVTGETCDGSSNGVIAITADANYNYTAVLTGNGVNTTQKFTATTTFSNLPAGTYTLTFTVDGQANYSKAYTVTVTQPQPLSVFATVNDAAGNIELNLSGGSVYHIQVNNKTYTTTESSFTVPLEQGNNALQVTTDRECQGIFTKLINPSLITAPYPMPFEGTLNLNLGSSNIATVSVRIYSANTGLQVFTADYQNKSGVLQLDLSRLDKGAYGLFLKLNNNQQEFKIIK
jgi:sugar lactone lactonase YvrE